MDMEIYETVGAKNGRIAKSSTGSNSRSRKS